MVKTTSVLDAWHAAIAAPAIVDKRRPPRARLSAEQASMVLSEWATGAGGSCDHVLDDGPETTRLIKAWGHRCRNEARGRPVEIDDLAACIEVRR